MPTGLWLFSSRILIPTTHNKHKQKEHSLQAMNLDGGAVGDDHWRAAEHHPRQHLIIQVLLLIQAAAAVGGAGEQLGIAHIQAVVLVEGGAGYGQGAVAGRFERRALVGSV